MVERGGGIADGQSGFWKKTNYILRQITQEEKDLKKGENVSLLFKLDT